MATWTGSSIPTSKNRDCRPETLRRWIAPYAAATATTASYETIRDAATSGQHDRPSRSTTQPWRDVLERLWIFDPVPAWLPTQKAYRRKDGTALIPAALLGP